MIDSHIQITKYNLYLSNMQTTKTKRVFQLRKTGSARPQNNQQSRVLDQEEPAQTLPVNQKTFTYEQPVLPNDTYKQFNPLPKQQVILVSHPQITVDQQELHFYQKIQNVQVKNIKVKNIGSSAIYFSWVIKNLPKINPNAIKDPKPNFYCHYQPNVIKPGQELVFSFSFFSETPGVFVEEIQLVCQPEPATPIPPIRLKGIAYIEDSLKNERSKLAHDLKERAIEAFTKQVLCDIVNKVKSPVPPLPDVSNQEIAQKQFEQSNSNQKLYYNPQVHRWFTSLYNDICNACEIPQQKRHWNQSTVTLAELIGNVKDPILQQSFDKRLQNYKSLSTTKPAQKSDLFPKIKQYLLQVGYMLGGSIADQSKKQLEMWEIPFEQPSQTQTEQEVAAKKDQRNKIIAQWAKKMKKKKWGPDQQNQLLGNYRTKLQKGTSKALVAKFDGFDDQANFQSCKAKIKEKFDSKKYFGFLERLKTVQQFGIQGKKILLKFDLKLKENSGEALIKLQQYLQKKKQEELRAQQQRKNQQANKTKKKAAPAKKKKGQKQEQEQKVLTYDFSTLLDQESWQGLISTLKFIIEKQPVLLIIGISFGPKIGVFNQKASIKYLLEPLKTVEPSIEFLDHQGLFGLKKKIEEESLNQGSIYLTQNLSFLPCEGMEKGSIKIIQKVQNGQQKKEQVIETQKMLMSQVEDQLSEVMPSIDIIVRQDRFVNRISGICSYGKKVNITGLAWWKYIAFALRSQGSNILLGGEFSPEKLVLLSRLTKYAGKIYLAGQLGVKIWMATHDIHEFYSIKNTKNEADFIKYFLENQKQEQTLSKIILPQDFLLVEQKQNDQAKINFKSGDKVQNSPNTKVVDIGQLSCQQIMKIQNGHFFIIDHPSVNKASTSSLEKLCKNLYNKKEAKKSRHLLQQSTPAGINYEKDCVNYLIGIQESDLEKIELKQKKPKKKEGEEEQEEEQPEQEEQVKKIDQICDFRINDTGYFLKLLSAEYQYGLKDISKYPKSD